MRKGWIEREDTRLLREANHGADVLRLLARGTEVEVLEELERFTKVRVRDQFADEVGYVYHDFLETERVDPPAQGPKYEYLLPCPRCGTKSWGIFPLQQSGGHGFSQNYYIPTGFLSGVTVQSRACLRCGYLELCVEEDDLEELRRLALQQRQG